MAKGKRKYTDEQIENRHAKRSLVFLGLPLGALGLLWFALTFVGFIALGVGGLVISAILIFIPFVYGIGTLCEFIINGGFLHEDWDTLEKHYGKSNKK